jgi:YVTN family beta-propeller protein
MSERRLPPDLLTEIDSPIRETRLAGVDQLTRLVYSSDVAVAAVARRALERLTSDDSRSVAAAAVAALERTAVRLTPDAVDFGYVPPDTPELVADVLVNGPPLAIATATVTISGPGLRASLTGRHLRIVWQPRSAWLDGSVTIRGKAGWADVRVTGQVAAGPMSRADVVERLSHDEDRGGPVWVDEGAGAARVTVFSPPPARRHVRGTVLMAVLAVLLLGGAGVAVAVNRTSHRDRPPAAAAAVTPAQTAVASSPTLAAPIPKTVSSVPAAARVASVAKPAVIGTIRVDAEPEGVTVSPDGRTVYVANQGSHILSVVDSASRRVTSVSLRHTPRFVTTSRDGRLVFVSMYEQDMSGSGVAVLDAASRKVMRYLMTGVQPYTLAVGPDDHLWVPIHSQHRIEIYTTGDQRPVGQVRVPPNPHAVGFSAKLRRAFTSNHESNAVSVIDMRRNRLVKSIPVSRAPHSIAVSPDGRTVLVAGYEANTADLIDAATLRRTGPFRVGSKPQSVAFAVDGRHAYVVNEGDNSLSILDGHTGKVTATVRVGGSPRTIAVAPDGRLAYVSNGDDGTLSVLRVGT